MLVSVTEICRCVCLIEEKSSSEHEDISVTQILFYLYVHIFLDANGPYPQNPVFFSSRQQNKRDVTADFRVTEFSSPELYGL